MDFNETVFTLRVDLGVDVAHCGLHERAGLRPTQYAQCHPNSVGVQAFRSEQDERTRQRPEWRR